jgi:hypothetical protein
MTTCLTTNDRLLPASTPGRADSGCTMAPTPWTAGPHRVTASAPRAANEAAAGTTTASDAQDAPAMTVTQRAALAALIHSPAETRTSRWLRRDHVGDVAWAAVLVLLLGLSVDSLFEGLRFVRTADALQTTAATRPPVDEPVALEAAARGRSPGTARRRLQTPGQSSGVVSRTM